MTSIRQVQISRELPASDRDLANEISRSPTTGDPTVGTLSTLEVERAWQERDRFANTPERLQTLIRLSKQVGARVPAELSADPTEKIFGPKASTRRTRILCTVGPASSDPDKLAAMITAGMDAARINFSHIKKPEEAKVLVDALKTAMTKAGRTISIIADLQGPKLRTGLIDPPMELAKGSRVMLYTEGTVRPSGPAVPLGHPQVVPSLQVGDRIYVDDGKISLQVRSKTAGAVEVEVLSGGQVSSKKGLNLPDTSIPDKVPTQKDRGDLETIRALGIDTVMVSYVESAADLDAVRKLAGPGAKLIAKIERAKAMDELEAIAKASDGLLVARGDGAVELGDEHMPVAQARINQVGNELGIPTGVATQMMESMLSSPRPSRSDASDVARAVMERADWVMTSAETAIGSAPEAIIGAMAKIIDATEQPKARSSYSPMAVRGSGEIEIEPRRLVAKLGATTPLRFSGSAAEPVRAASAIVPFVGGWLIAQDDSNVAAHVTSAGTQAIGLLGHASVPDAPLSKAKKPDFEAAVAIRTSERELAVLFGSGSSPLRMKAAIVEGAQTKSVSLDALYLGAMDALGISASALNIEAACVVGKNVRFFQRGNSTEGFNATFEVPLDRLLDALDKKRSLTRADLTNVRKLALGTLDGVSLGFSAAAPLPDGRVLFAASAEDTPNTIDDGTVAGSIVGIFDKSQRIVATWSLPGAPVKLEGLALERLEGTTAHLLAVTDSDDPGSASQLLRYTLDLSTVPG